jgi:ATP-dependent helicase/nuclease subunit A
LQTFYQLACDMENGGNRDLGRFLEHLDAMEEKGLLTAGDQSREGCVTIMSIHKSKGLEFPVVFLCGLGRTFNTESQLANLLCHKELGLGLSAVDHQHRLRYPTIAKRAISAKIGEEALSEELRVLYVAMTRARDRLIMTYASNRLEKDLTEMVQQMNAGCHQLLIGQTVCPGEWVLLTALHRTEAGELFALGGNPGNTTVSQFPWLIRVVTAPKLTSSGKQAVQKEVDTRLVAQLRESIAFHYPHTLAITTPSKQTATQRKGRQKDEEAAEGTSNAYAPSRQWRKPSFMQQQVAGKEYGSATHKFMQYLDFAACETEEKIARELRRLVDHGYLTEKQAALVDIAKVFDFFQTEFGQKLRSGVNIIREFKFSVMEDGQLYDAQLKGEQVLLQGVVDCALIGDDGITVVDFKTDHVTEQTLAAVVDRYREQVRFYARVMERIYRKPVREAMLYFFSLNRFVSV